MFISLPVMLICCNSLFCSRSLWQSNHHLQMHLGNGPSKCTAVTVCALNWAPSLNFVCILHQGGFWEESKIFVNDLFIFENSEAFARRERIFTVELFFILLLSGSSYGNFYVMQGSHHIAITNVSWKTIYSPIPTVKMSEKKALCQWRIWRWVVNPEESFKTKGDYVLSKYTSSFC